MKITVKSWHAIGYWKWETGQTEEDGEEDVCGICRVAYEGCCPGCKMPGDDCPLSITMRFSVCIYVDEVHFTSVGRMQPCLPYALHFKMARDHCVKAMLSDGSSTMG